MIVCSCYGTTDREIRDACRAGNLEGCPAGSCCGNCEPHVSAITDTERSASDSSSTEPPVTNSGTRRGV